MVVSESPRGPIGAREYHWNQTQSFMHSFHIPCVSVAQRRVGMDDRSASPLISLI